MPHLFHITPSFAPGGAQVRTTQIMNHLGPEYRHTVVSLNGDFGAQDRVDASVPVRYVACRQSCNPLYMLGRLAALLNEERPQLVLTYNWGSIDAVAAAGLAGLGPVIHAEDGFGDDEAESQKLRRVLFRRLMLPSVFRVVAPSETLLEIIRGVWKLPEESIEHIPNGIDMDRFAASPRPPKDEPVIGTVGHLRREKRQELLFDACAGQPVRILIAGDGPERSGLEERARSLGLADRTTFLGHVADTAPAYRQMDLFALPSRTEQMPLAVLEAMASGLAVVSTDVGDVKAMVSAENRPFIASSPEDFREALRRLAADPGLRQALGEANRARCRQLFDVRRMLERYAALYEAALRS